jgi:RNA polymerase sigma factor for flagellar operon FliA
MANPQEKDDMPANEVSDAELEKAVIQHATLVKRIAYHLKARLPATVQTEDLYQAGMIGLIEAVRNYDKSLGAKFETYAGIRIRGSMLDELRRSDWAPKSVHRRGRELAEAIHVVENRTGRDARDSEVAEQMGVSLDEYNRVLQDSSTCIMSMEQLGIDKDEFVEGMMDLISDPIKSQQHDDFKESLMRAIAGLPERERMIVTLYYDSELNLREIGSVIGVTESRVSQLLNQAHARLRSRLTEWV